jgi:hypothetical protein
VATNERRSIIKGCISNLEIEKKASEITLAK